MAVQQISDLHGREIPRRAITLLLAGLLGFGAGPARPAAAQENKILTATKSALYGCAAGLLLGGAASLVVSEADRDNVIRWGVVIGTFGGFAYGIYDTQGRSGEYSNRLCRPRNEGERVSLSVARPLFCYTQMRMPASSTRTVGRPRDPAGKDGGGGRARMTLCPRRSEPGRTAT